MNNDEIIEFLKKDLKLIAKDKDRFKNNPIPEGHSDFYLMEYADKLYESINVAIQTLEGQKTGHWIDKSKTIWLWSKLHTYRMQ